MFKRITDLIHRYGVKGTLLRFLTKSMSLFGFDVRYNVLMEYTLSANIPESNSQIWGGCKQLQFSDLCKYGDKSWFNPQKLEYEKKSFATPGNVAMGIIQNEQLICYGWVNANYWACDTNCILGEGDAYLWSDWVHPDFRGKKLHNLLIQERLRYAKQMNKSRALAVVLVYNRASYKGYERLGFRRAKRFFIIYNKWTKKQFSTLHYGLKPNDLQ